MQRYILFTNIWNEESRIEPTFQMVSEFTLKPAKWIWINDGSTDNSKTEILRCIKKFPQLHVVYYERPVKNKGDLTTIGRAYNAVFEDLSLRDEEYDFMAIIDVDNKIHPDYFRTVAEIFEQQPEVGVISGWNPKAPRLKMPTGNGKCVRWTIIKRIEKFWDPAPDTFLNIKAKAMGYKWLILEEGVGLMTGQLGARIKTASGVRHAGWMWSYASGSYLGALTRTFYRILKRRHGLAFLKGFLDNQRAKTPRHCEDPDVIAFYQGQLKYK